MHLLLPYHMHSDYHCVCCLMVKDDCVVIVSGWSNQGVLVTQVTKEANMRQVAPSMISHFHTSFKSTCCCDCSSSFDFPQWLVS